MRDTIMFSGHWPLAHSLSSSSILTRNWGFVQKEPTRHPLNQTFVVHGVYTHTHTIRPIICRHRNARLLVQHWIQTPWIINLILHMHAVSNISINKAFMLVCSPPLSIYIYIWATFIINAATSGSPRFPAAIVKCSCPDAFRGIVQKIRTEAAHINVFEVFGEVLHWHPAVKYVTENIWFMFNTVRSHVGTTVNTHQNSPSLAKERHCVRSFSLTLFHNDDLKVMQKHMEILHGLILNE